MLVEPLPLPLLPDLVLHGAEPVGQRLGKALAAAGGAAERERERCEWQAGVSAQNWRPSLALDSNLSAANVLADFIFCVCVYLCSE